MGARKPPQKQRDRLEELMNAKLIKIRLGDLCSAEASGPQIVVVQGPQGPDTQLGWQLTVWLEHDKLLGQGPLGVTVPVSGLLIADEMIDLVTTRLLDEARKIRHKANNPSPNGQGGPTVDDVMTALRQSLEFGKD